MAVMKLGWGLFLCALLIFASNATIYSRFGSVLSRFNTNGHQLKRSGPTKTIALCEPSRLTSIISNLKSSIFQVRMLNILRQIQRSPKLQEFLLSTSEKCLSYGLFMLAFKMVSRTFATSWNEINSQLSNIKENSNSVKVLSNSTTHQYLNANTTLNSYEEDILQSMILPTHIESTLEDIGGLDMIKETLCDVLQPMKQQPGSSVTGLFAPTRSVLLYGPPGCGKSMLVRALCRRLSIPLLSVAPSMLLRMYVGETPRLTKALFTLASKLQPCMIFIDEADSLFCARGTSDHAVDRKIVTEFMQLWDDLLRDKADVYILGATNRPQDLDPAILRRFERSFLVSSPDLRTRKEVFSKTLRGMDLDSCDFDLQCCAAATEGYTSSDIVSVCRTAVMRLGRDTHRSENGDIESKPLRTQDVLEALKTIFPTSWAAADYARTLQLNAADPTHHHHQQQEHQQQNKHQPHGAGTRRGQRNTHGLQSGDAGSLSQNTLNSFGQAVINSMNKMNNMNMNLNPYSEVEYDMFDEGAAAADADDGAADADEEIDTTVEGSAGSGREDVPVRWGYDEQVNPDDYIDNIDNEEDDYDD